MTYSRYQRKPLLKNLTDRDPWPPPPSPWVRWQLLSRLSPQLNYIHGRRPGRREAPLPLYDGTFVSLCASFAEPSHREALRALILDLLAEDLADLLADVGTGGNQ